MKAPRVKPQPHISPQEAADMASREITSRRRSQLERERLEIAGLIGQATRNVSELARLTAMNPDVVRQHLQRLYALGLIERHIEGSGFWKLKQVGRK